MMNVTELQPDTKYKVQVSWKRKKLKFSIFCLLFDFFKDYAFMQRIKDIDIYVYVYICITC